MRPEEDPENAVGPWRREGFFFWKKKKRKNEEGNCGHSHANKNWTQLRVVTRSECLSPLRA